MYKLAFAESTVGEGRLVSTSKTERGWLVFVYAIGQCCIFEGTISMRWEGEFQNNTNGGTELGIYFLHTGSKQQQSFVLLCIAVIQSVDLVLAYAL